MDRKEAMLLLQACRPDNRDASLPVFAEALALTERDPELKTWWEARQAFDRKVSAKLREVPVPGDLRATILAGRKIEQLTPGNQVSYWLAAAAAVLLLGLLGSVLLAPSSTGPQRLTHVRYDSDAIAFLGNDAPSLGTTSPDRAKLVAWLRQQHSPTGTIPATLDKIPTVGCQTFSVDGHPVSLICFALSGGGIAHLFIVDRTALSDPPGFSPVFNQKGNWATAAWSDSNKSYLLVSEAGLDTIRHLL